MPALLAELQCSQHDVRKVMSWQCRVMLVLLANCQSRQSCIQGVPGGLCCADFKTRWLGAQHNAYPPVIAGGTDATTIHYARKDKASSLALQDLYPCLPPWVAGDWRYCACRQQSQCRPWVLSQAGHIAC